MAEKPSKKPVAAKLFGDVKPASETTADKASKPVIIGHTNIIKDPMVSVSSEKIDNSSNPTDSVTPEEKLMSRPAKELRIEPVSSKSSESNEAIVKDENSKEFSEATEEIKNSTPEPTVNNTEDDSSGIDNNESGGSISTGAIDSIVENVNTKKENAIADEKERQRLEEIEKLVASKKYFLKISDTPRQRNAKLIFLLVLVVFLGLVGWYMMMGPGQNMWLKKQPVEQTATNAPVKDIPAKTPVAQTNTYNNPANGISFDYPSDWQLSETTDAKNASIKTLTLVSPKQMINVADKSNTAVPTEVSSRLRIFIEPSKYSLQAKIRSCSSTNVVVASQNLALIYSSSDQIAPSVNQISLANALCPSVDKNGYYNIDNNLKLSTKTTDNRYVLVSDYVYTADYLKKLNSKISQSDLELAQSVGLSMTKDEFTKPKTYSQTLTLFESIKSL
jgi:hypothetical protein